MNEYSLAKVQMIINPKPYPPTILLFVSMIV